MLVVPLSPEIENSLHALAEERGRSEVDIVRDLIEQYLEDQQDIHRSEEVLNNPGRIWSMDDVEREFGLEH